MYPARIDKESVREIPRKFVIFSLLKKCLVNKSARGSHKSVEPMFPYCIQTVIYEEKAKEIAPIKEGKSFNPIPFLRKRYIKNPARRGCRAIIRVQEMLNGNMK